MIAREPDLSDHGPPIYARTALVEKPPWAAFCWTDEESLWVELPCPVGKAPVIVQYPKTEAGYAKAMNLVEQCANIKRAAPPPGWFKHMQTTKQVDAKPDLAKQSESLHESLNRILKKQGIL